MFGKFRRLLGLIKVTEGLNTILVEGIPGDVMARDISRIWSTSRIANHMFTHIGKDSIEFPRYFALDILYTIDSILADRTRYVSTRVLHNVREKLMNETWLAKLTEQHPDRLNLDRLKDFIYHPLEFQMRFIETYNTVLNKYNLSGYLFAGTAGSGKTLTSLMIAQCLEADLVVIICPANALERVWESSIQTLFKEKQTYWMANRNVPVSNKDRILVGHYEALDKVKAAMMTRKAQLGHGCKVAVILDESHNLNEIISLRTQKFLELCKAAETNDVLWLSGTPVKAVGAEAISLFRCIDPMFTEDVEQRFKKIYGKNASKGLDILQNRIGTVSFKVEKKELNLLDPIMHQVRVTIPDGEQYTLKSISVDMAKFIDQQKELYGKSKAVDTKTFYNYLDVYKASLKTKGELMEYGQYIDCLEAVIKAHDGGYLREVKDESIFCNKYEKDKIGASLQGKDKETFKHVKTLVKYVSLKIQGECLGRVLGKKRTECHVKMVPHINFVEICEFSQKKTLVFTSFVDALKEADKTLKENGMMPLVVYGETNKDLSSIIKQFEADEDINPLVATYNSLSTAVPLVMADNMITINAPFRNYILEQAISRIHRLGADTQTHIWMVTLDTGKEPNMSTRSSEILQWSQQQVEKIMGVAAPFEVTEGFENLKEGDTFQISMEEYDIHETVLIPKVQSAVAFANW